MKNILSVILTAAIFLSPVTSFAADNSMLTYQEVFNKVLIAQNEIDIYNELIADLKTIWLIILMATSEIWL